MAAAAQDSTYCTRGCYLLHSSPPATSSRDSIHTAAAAAAAERLE